MQKSRADATIDLMETPHKKKPRRHGEETQEGIKNKKESATDYTDYTEII
jgi:malate synthase